MTAVQRISLFVGFGCIAALIVLDAIQNGAFKF